MMTSGARYWRVWISGVKCFAFGVAFPRSAILMRIRGDGGGCGRAFLVLVVLVRAAAAGGGSADGTRRPRGDIEEREDELGEEDDVDTGEDPNVEAVETAVGSIEWNAVEIGCAGAVAVSND